MHRERKRFSKAEVALLVVSSSFTALVIAGGVWWQAINMLPEVKIPTPKLPSPNAYDYYVSASNVVGRRKIYAALAFERPGTNPNNFPRNAAIYHRYTWAEKEALVAQNASSLHTLRHGFSYICRCPPVRSFATLPLTFRLWALFSLLKLEGHVNAARGDWSQTANSYLDIMRLESDCARGNPTPYLRVGFPVRRELWKVENQLNAAQARAAARRLENIISDRPQPVETLQEQKWTGQAERLELMSSPNWRSYIIGTFNSGASNAPSPPHVKFELWLHSKRQILDDYTKYMDALIANARQPYAISCKRPLPSPPADPVNQLLEYYRKSNLEVASDETQNGLLLVALALRAYRLEHGTYPATLKELMPSYLHRIPADAFALNQPLRYKRTGQQYVLYSVGPDGRDDGGKPIEGPAWGAAPTSENQYFQLSPDARGDIVAGINIR